MLVQRCGKCAFDCPRQLIADCTRRFRFHRDKVSGFLRRRQSFRPSPFVSGGDGFVMEGNHELDPCQIRASNNTGWLALVGGPSVGHDPYFFDVDNSRLESCRLLI